MESNFLRKISTLFLILNLPKLGSSDCIFGVNNTSQLVQRNQTILGIMNDTVLDFTDSSDAAVSSVSDFELWNYLKINNSIRPANYLEFVSKGRMLLINWTIATRGGKTNETKSRTIASYIMTEFVTPLHSMLQDLAVKYSFSLGIFRPFHKQLRFTGITLPTNLTEKLTLDLSCTAGSWLIWRISTNYLYNSAFDVKNSTHFANFVTPVERMFDQYYRKHTILNKDFVRVNVIEAFAGTLNYTVLHMEIYFMNETFDLAYITKETSINNLPNFQYQDPTKSTNVAVNVRPETIYTYILNVSSTTSTSTARTGAVMTTEASTTSSTSISALTDLLTSSTNLSSLTESSSITSTTVISYTNASTSDITSSTTGTTLSPEALTHPLITSALLSNSSTLTELLISNVSTTIANFTTFATDFASNASYSTTVAPQTTVPAEQSNSTVTSSIENTSLKVSVTTQLSQRIPVSTDGYPLYQNDSNSNLVPNASSTTLESNALLNDSLIYQTTGSSNVSSSISSATDSSASTATNVISNSSTTGTSNGISFGTSKSTSNGDNGTGNPSPTQITNQTTTFDPDPFFKPTAPMIRKIYNDHVLLKQIGPMAPLTEKVAFFSITLPTALGISIAVIACMLCLQLELLSGKRAA